MNPSAATSARERTAAAVFGLYKRLLSPMLHALGPTQCKYLPTCSDYGYAAVVRYGWSRGGWLALRRLGRCHPWSRGGFDPVP